MTLKTDAEQEVREGFCSGCSAIGCNNEDICDGFKKEADSIINEWLSEYNSAASDCIDCESIKGCRFKNCKILTRRKKNESRRPHKTQLST